MYTIASVLRLEQEKHKVHSMLLINALTLCGLMVLFRIVKDVLGSFVQGFIMAAEDEYLDRLHLIYEQTKTLLQRLAARLSVSDAGTTFEVLLFEIEALVVRLWC